MTKDARILAVVAMLSLTMKETDLTLSRRQSLLGIASGLAVALGACSNRADPQTLGGGGSSGGGDADAGASGAVPGGSSGTGSGSNGGSTGAILDDAGASGGGTSGGVTGGPVIDCTLTPEQEEGPFFVELAKIRKNIVDGKAGTPLTLRITLLNANGCAPIEGAAIDVWHCDAVGAYSTANDGMFLRGVQLTDAKGSLEITTIYPGWYPNRTNHIHVKVHIGSTSAGATLSGGHVSHTGNLFFSEAQSLEVAAVAPYTQNGVARTPLTSDFVYVRQNGSSVVMNVSPVNPTVAADGYVASIVLGIDPAATPALIGIHS